ncbi:MAG: endonuclease [Clostridia bacterium]|nr:endonuclease [Clostridia bacterium]
MKITIKKSLAVILALVMCVSMFFRLDFVTQAASYIYNWGTRGTVATELSENAEAFYTENDVALSELLALSGSSTESGVPSSALYTTLHDLMESNHDNVTSYDGTRDLYRYTDCENGGSPSTISSFYSGAAIGPDWDGGDTWNREHTWPNSKGDLAGNGENDIMMLRPAATSENGSRSNKAYGESTGYFNPNIGSYDLRGDVARIILYQYVRWECTNTGSSYNSTGIFGTDGVIESQEMLLDWLQADPVDTWEMGRNDAVEAITGTRNVFVDYPELGFDLFDEAVPTGYTTPSGGADVDGSTGSGDDNTGDTSSTTGKNVVFELGENGEATHSDGSSQTSYTETVDGYTLNITDGTKFYTGARDEKGNSAIKMGTSSAAGSFSMTVPADVTKVIFKVAGYKAKTVTVSVNGTSQAITTTSDNGAYTDVEVDTTSTKTITFTTGTNYRCMIDSITYVVPGSSSEDGDKVYVDEDSVVISGASSAFAEDTVVTAVVITSGDSFDTANTALADMAFKKIYEITATNGGTAVQPESPLTITFDIPTGYNVDNTYIVYIDESGVVETLETLEKTETTISAQISHFSTYAVVDTTEVSGGEETVEVEATINFNSSSFIETGATAQIWSENGVTVTTNKGTYTGAFYTTISDHTRWYNGHEIVTEYTYPISKIVFTTTGTSYTTLLANSLTSSGLGTVTSSGTTITLELTTPSETVTFSHVNSATRVKSMTLTAQKPADGGDTTEAVITPTVNNTAYGSVELSGNYIIATPNDGYEVIGYEVVSGTATVTQNGNNFTVEADADVTVQINFAARTQYTATFKEMGSTTSTQTAYSGDSITLPTLTSDDYTVVGWVAAEIDGETTDKPTVYNAGSNFAVTGNVTFYALYSRTQAGGSGESDVFAEYTGAITEGDYLIVYDSGAMKASVTSSRLDYTEVTVSGNSITSPDASLIWTVTADGSYYTLYNESTGKYAAGTGAKNKAQLLSAVEDKARWTVSGTATYEFVNKANAEASVNANLRRNGTYGFACYATGTGGALTLYKRTAAAMTTYYFTSAGETPDYTVTANANDDTFGTVTVSGTTVSATPNEGYTVAGYSIVSGTAAVTREGNTFFVTPESDVEITVNFEALPTYTVTFVENGAEVGTDSTYSGGFIKLPEYSGELDEYTTFNGWAEKEDETDSTKIYAAKATYAVTKNVTLYAQFTVTEPPVVESDHYFTKVTEDQTDWTGTYLIVYEAGSIAFNGAMADKLDAEGNGVGVTIADGKIAATDANIAVSFVVEKIEGGYTIRSKSGLYFGSESDTNSLLSNATKTYFNNFAIDADGNTTVTGEGGAILRYNAASNQNRFRFYKTSSYTSQQPIALYKLDVATMFGAQVKVDADITIKYYVDVTNSEGISAGDLVMQFIIDDEVVDTVAGTEKDGKYVFDLAHLAPQRITDVIKAELLYKGTLIDVKDDYSIKENVLAILEANPTNTSLKRFVSDLLYYGEAAQNYTKYNTDNLATNGLTKGEDGDIYAVDETILPEASDSVFNLSATTGDAGFKSATVWFDSTNSLIVKVSKRTEDTAVKVYVTPYGGTKVELDYNSDIGGYKTADIGITDFDKEYKFELCDEGGNVIQTLTYSVNSYAYSIYKKYESDDTSTMKALALALFRLGQSAKEL